MSASPASAVATTTTAPSAGWQPTAKRLLPLRAPPRIRCADLTLPGSSLEDRCRWCAPGQVSWLSDHPTPRAFPADWPVASAGFVPDYSDGVAAVSHRLPWALASTLGADNAQTVTERAGPRNARPRA